MPQAHPDVFLVSSSMQAAERRQKSILSPWDSESSYQWNHRPLTIVRPLLPSDTGLHWLPGHLQHVTIVQSLLSSGPVCTAVNTGPSLTCHRCLASPLFLYGANVPFRLIGDVHKVLWENQNLAVVDLADGASDECIGDEDRHPKAIRC